METKPAIESLLIRYFEGKSDEKEYAVLEDWYEASEEHRREAEEVYRLWYAMQTCGVLQQVDPVKALRRVDKRIRNRRRTLFVWRTGGIAAGIAILFGVMWLWTLDVRTPGLPIAGVAHPVEQDTAIRLILAERKIEVNGRQEAHIRYSKGRIVMDSVEVDVKTAADPETPVYHQLIVPAGKRSSIILADGSEVWVNSRSRLVFPEVFGKSGREVYVEGEAFFRVKQEAGRPFTVRTKKFGVNALGTVFNVSAYEGEKLQQVVLVSGKVRVETAKREQYVLAPEELFECSEDQVTIRKTDPADYISWVNGVCTFRSEPLKAIVERLSRYYGKKIVCKEGVGDIRCSGKLELKEKLEDVLLVLSQVAPVGWIEREEEIELVNAE